MIQVVENGQGTRKRSASLRVPNFFIAGEQKAGTTYLYESLRYHAQVFMASPKEPLFFSDWNYDPCKVDEYLAKHFASAGAETWVGEASASYFHSDSAARRIRKNFGTEVKFLVCLRHPTEKAVSLYLHNYRRGRLTGHERLNDLESTQCRIRAFTEHSSHCARLLEDFGPDNVLFLFYQNLRSSPSAFVETAHSFLGLNVELPPPPRCVNKGNDLRWDGDVLTIDESYPVGERQVRPQFARQELEEWHDSAQRDVNRTERITGLDLASWKQFPKFTSVIISILQLLGFLDDVVDVLFL